MRPIDLETILAGIRRCSSNYGDHTPTGYEAMAAALLGTIITTTAEPTIVVGVSRQVFDAACTIIEGEYDLATRFMVTQDIIHDLRRDGRPVLTVAPDFGDEWLEEADFDDKDEET